VNTGSTFSTALLRGLYTAIVVGLIAALTVYQNGGYLNEQEAVVTGLLAALGALGVRGVVEGTYDATRQGAGDVKPSDVQPNVSTPANPNPDGQI
jgi:hypothetical protein